MTGFVTRHLASALIAGTASYAMLGQVRPVFVIVWVVTGVIVDVVVKIWRTLR